MERSGQPRQFHDGPTVALVKIERGQLGYAEEPFLVLRFCPSGYYNCLATTMSLDDLVSTEDGSAISVRHKYLQDLSYESPLRYFSNAFSVNLSVITKDGFIIVAKRGVEGIAPYPGYVSPAKNECVNYVADRDAGGSLSLFATAKRGASHELNIEISEDELVFFTVGLDLRYYSYLLTGLVRSKTFTRDDVISRRTHGSKERWESQQLYFLSTISRARQSS